MIFLIHIFGGKGRKGTAAIRRNHKKIKETTFLTDKITEEALQFLDDQSGQAFLPVSTLLNAAYALSNY